MTAEAAQAVTIVFPLRNEAEGLPRLAASLRALRAELAPAYAPRFVFVDDGSSDGTAAELGRCFGGEPDCEILRHATNRGIAAAIATGVSAARSELCASADSDGSYDLSELARMFDLAERAELVTASPYHPKGSVEGVSAARLFLSRTLSRLYRLVLGARVHTWTSCFRVYRRSAVADFRPRDPGFVGVAELCAEVLRAGGRVVEHPTTLRTRRSGRSKMRVVSAVRGHLAFLLRAGLARGKAARA